MSNRTFPIVFFLFGLSSCATTHQEPNSQAQFATMIFEKGYKDGASWGRASAQKFVLIEDMGCKKSKRIARLSWISPREVSKRVEAGIPLSLEAISINFSSAGSALIANGAAIKINETYCKVGVEFTPISGRSYRVKLLELDDGACQLNLIHEETKTRVKDAIFKVTDLCEPN